MMPPMVGVNATSTAEPPMISKPGVRWGEAVRGMGRGNRIPLR